MGGVQWKIKRRGKKDQGREKHERTILMGNEHLSEDKRKENKNKYRRLTHPGKTLHKGITNS